MLFGFYEQEVLAALVSASKERGTFIDIGAADGYYGIAAVSQGLFNQSYLFEISQLGRSVIRENALLNKVSDLVSIQGEADVSALEAIPESRRNDAVVLITCNRKLGAEGYLYLEEQFGVGIGSGNLGILDQIEVLKWVQRNV